MGLLFQVEEAPPASPQPEKEVPKATFEAMFRQQHGAPQPTPAPVDTNLVSAATVVLDARTQEAKKAQADALLDAVQDGERHQRPLENEFLQPRSEPNVPLPESTANPTDSVDDLEF